VLVFAAVYVPLFTSLGQNPDGLGDSFASLAVWTQTGAETQVQPLQQYLVWMARPELHILVLGTIGGLIVAWRGNSRVEVFLGLWALGITMAYSIVTYKTPWIALNMIVPLAILGGIAVRELAIAITSIRLRTMAAAGAAVLVAFAGWQAVDLSFNRYDDEAYGYVFVHSTRDIYGLMDEANAAADRAGGEKDGIVFVSGDYWPLPWYFRDNPKAGFFGSFPEQPIDEAVIIANVNQDAEVSTRYSDRYVRRPGEYTLRPGVELSVWVRSDLASG
jgi:uncharacterized protein (TIGR03663 family)